ncbi:hypothetical protein ACFYZB_38180 [Streptomyces sp. NPDC001852]|uniref:hypothetical protein n=1 Tax=Streptomyces sp. NPDC001852 TaxID=3364619 RepID=UPI00369BB83F
MSLDPTEPDRWCSVSRNDGRAQELQPTANQVERAVDMAVRGNPHAGSIRQGGYRHQTDMSSIDPQGLFPAPILNGPKDTRILANVMLGTLAQYCHRT